QRLDEDDPGPEGHEGPDREQDRHQAQVAAPVLLALGGIHQDTPGGTFSRALTGLSLAEAVRRRHGGVTGVTVLTPVTAVRAPGVPVPVSGRHGTLSGKR